MKNKIKIVQKELEPNLNHSSHKLLCMGQNGTLMS